MALAWCPEPLSAMQARYAQAIAEVYDQALIAAGQQERPGRQRKHVFDFRDGLRLIVSRDRANDGRVGIFVSGSFVPNTPMHDLLRRATDIESELCRVIQERWRMLAGSNHTPKLLGSSSGKGVPHFVLWQVE